jgi:hypothetical protein
METTILTRKDISAVLISAQVTGTLEVQNEQNNG